MVVLSAREDAVVNQLLPAFPCRSALLWPSDPTCCFLFHPAVSWTVADISKAFPSLRKPAAKQRRRSLSDLDAICAGCAASEAAADEAAVGPSSGAAAAAAAGNEASAFGNYWSDPLPVAVARPVAGLDDDMQDTAASPASSGDGGCCCSPAASGMDACCSSLPAPPAFSPLREFTSLDVLLAVRCYALLPCQPVALLHLVLPVAICSNDYSRGTTATRAAHCGPPRLWLPFHHTQGSYLPGPLLAGLSGGVWAERNR